MLYLATNYTACTAQPPACRQLKCFNTAKGKQTIINTNQRGCQTLFTAAMLLPVFPHTLISLNALGKVACERKRGNTSPYIARSHMVTHGCKRLHKATRGRNKSKVITRSNVPRSLCATEAIHRQSMCDPLKMSHIRIIS